MQLNHIVKELNNVFHDFAIYEARIRKQYQLRDTDIRFTYYRHSHHNIDSAIHLLMISASEWENKSHLESLYQMFKIPSRFKLYEKLSKTPKEILFEITNQFIANGYSTIMYHLFEHSFRVICQEYDVAKYNRQKGRFGAIFPTFVKDFKEQTNLLDDINIEVYEYVQIVRNSLHNNGVFVSPTKTDRTDILNLDNIRITLKHNQHITVTDSWYELLRMSRWYLMIFTGIIAVPKIASLDYIEDPSY